MTVGMSFKIALKALGRNKMRTTLTMLGMIIGVAAVLTMVALGTGAQTSVEDEVRASGTNLVYVNAGNYTRGGRDVGIPAGRGAATTLTVEDGVAITDNVDGVSYAVESVTERGQMTAGDNRFFGRIRGVGYNWPEIYSWNWKYGEHFEESQISSRSNVAILGSVVSDKLFGQGTDPVGQTIQIWDSSFEIVGVTDTTTDDQNESVFTPFTTAQDHLQITHLHALVLAAESAGVTSKVSGGVTELLRERHGINAEEARIVAAGGGTPNLPLPSTTGGADMPGGGGDEESFIIQRGKPKRQVPDDFTVRTQAAQALTKGLYTSAAVFILANLPQLDDVTVDELANTLDKANTTMTALLASIAGVSLLVGGIGIMNIMLVSVTERTREIGIRMAVGARASDVLLQFLAEAITLSLIGGIAGILLGFIASDAVTRILEWPTQISPGAIGLAFGIAAAIGVFFGFYPARKASLLDPIDSLRYE